MTNSFNNIGCNNLVDTAFVPEAHTGKRADGNTNALREEAGEYIVLSLNDLFDSDFTIGTKKEGTPPQGLHVVIIDGEPEVKRGRNGLYVEFDLFEKASGFCWKTFVNQDALKQMLADISFYNNGMLSGKSGIQAINFLKTHPFNCWTLQTEAERTATYFNSEKFGRRIYVIENEKAKREKAEHKRAEQTAEKEKNDSAVSADSIKSSGTKRPTENKALKH